MAHEIPHLTGTMGHGLLTGTGFAVPMPVVAAGLVLTGWAAAGPASGPIGVAADPVAGTLTVDVAGTWKIGASGQCAHTAGAGIFSEHILTPRVNGLSIPGAGSSATTHPILPRYGIGQSWVIDLAAGDIVDLAAALTVGGADATRVITYERMQFWIERMR